jgi:transcription factor IIIB subunit 2
VNRRRVRAIKIERYSCFLPALDIIDRGVGFAQRKKKDKPRDASTPHGSTAAESVRNLLKKNPRYSKRINYDALKDLFVDSGLPTLEVMDEKDYTTHTGPLVLTGIEGKRDDHGVAVFPNGELDCIGIPSDQLLGDPPDEPAVLDEGDLDAEGELDDESDRGECYWEDAYEQEV